MIRRSEVRGRPSRRPRPKVANKIFRMPRYEDRKPRRAKATRVSHLMPDTETPVEDLSAGLRRTLRHDPRRPTPRSNNV
jgi:hypothetical protein